MRRWGLLFGVGMAATGCKLFERPPDGPKYDPIASGGLTSRPKDQQPTDRPPPMSGHWLDNPPGSAASGGDRPPVPAGQPHPGSVVGNPRDEGRGVLDGYVIDPDGRKLADVFIEVRAYGDGSGGAPVGVQTLASGYFHITGLKPGQTYQLTARVNRGGSELAGQLLATPPSVHIRLPLIEGLALPDGGTRPAGGTDRPAGGDAPASEDAPLLSPPAMPERPAPEPLSRDNLPSGTPTDNPAADGAWSPTRPSPPPMIPPPAGRPEKPAPRPDLFTPGPTPGWKLPTATVPGPSVPAVLPATPPRRPPPAANPDRSESRTVRQKPEFVLVDTLGRVREFPTGRADDLVLVDFMTTTCLPCKKAIPTLKQLQSRYGASGLEIIGVVCDDTDTPQRRAFAGRYSEQQNLNYLLYVEPNAKPGRVMDQFDVEFFPTLVLIDGTGKVRWKGDSRDLGKLDGLIREQLKK